MTVPLRFEQGPIRPPSEAGSLLIRATRNCPWNRCAFCGTYKGKKFSRRSVEEIKADIDAAKAVEDKIREMSWRSGDGGTLSRSLISQIWGDPALEDSFRSVVLWLAAGGDTVFLQDANSIMLSTDALVEILRHIKKTFPQVQRITSYARANSISAKSLDDLKRLREAGLTRLHVGMESGSDRVLKMIDKGVKARHLIDGGKRAVEAGISVCLYIIPGIGGRELSHENAVESARVVNAVNPDYVRFRSLYVKRGTGLADMAEHGSFTPPDEEEIVREIRLFIEHLEGVQTTLVSDHLLNLLQELEGTLPEDKERLLGIIDTFLSLPQEERLMFQLGRRGGALTYLAELESPGVKHKLRQAKEQIDRDVPGGIPEYIREMKRRFV